MPARSVLFVANGIGDEVVDADDVRMGEPPAARGLGLEGIDGLGRSGDGLEDELERDLLAQRRVVQSQTAPKPPSPSLRRSSYRPKTT